MQPTQSAADSDGQMGDSFNNRTRDIGQHCLYLVLSAMAVRTFAQCFDIRDGRARGDT